MFGEGKRGAGESKFCFRRGGVKRALYLIHLSGFAQEVPNSFTDKQQVKSKDTIHSVHWNKAFAISQKQLGNFS